MARKSWRSLAVALAISATSILGTPSDAKAQHWALGEWSGKIGNTTFYLEVREIKKDGTAVGGFATTTPVSNVSTKITVHDNDLGVEFPSTGAVMKVSRQGADLAGVYVTKEGRESKILFKQNPGEQIYFGELFLQGCSGSSKVATVIINGTAIRGISYVPGYIGPKFEGELVNDTYRASVQSASKLNYEYLVKRKTDEVTVDIKSGAEGSPQHCTSYGSLKQVVKS